MARHITCCFVTVLCCLGGCSDSSDSKPGQQEPPEPLLERYMLSSEDSVPEGVAFDPQQRSFYASSINGGSITRIMADGEGEVLASDPLFEDLLGASAGLNGIEIAGNGEYLIVARLIPAFEPLSADSSC